MFLLPMQDIVSCGFVKGLSVSPQSGQVTFALELTTPACPIKDEFERKARDYVAELPWVQQVQHAFCDSHIQCSQIQTKRMRSLSACDTAAVSSFPQQLGLYRPCRTLALAGLTSSSAELTWHACWRRWM
jgi:hypothetical protein